MTALPITVMSDDEIAALGRDPDASFGALATERGPLPLTALAVDARVVGVIASLDVTQTFVNTTATPIEATYIFPLPDRAAVTRFRMEVGDRVVDGVIEERGAAREQYDEAIAAGQRASITEEERPGVFTLRVGNLLPGDVATITLTLVGPLPIDDGEVTFQFPLVVAPRYIPGAALGGEQAGVGAAPDTDHVPDASRITPSVRLPGLPNPVRLSLRVELADRVREVVSSLHAVTASRRDAQVIEVAPGERLDRDFVLRWRVDPPFDDAELRSSLVCSDDADGKAGTFMATLVPPSSASTGAKPRDVVFVLDRSGSMQGWKMVAARRAVGRMIDTLTSRDRFCALAFDDEVEHVGHPGLASATDRHRFRALEALAKIEARNGTEMAEPLEKALSLLAGGTLERERVIVFVTDGQVGNEDDVLRRIAGKLRNIKMFTLGIDQAVNAAFLRRLAAAGGGLCEVVESEDRLDAVMAKVHRRIGQPIATELVLAASDLELEPGSASPAKLPDVYAGAPVTIFGRYRGAASANASIVLAGTTLGDAVSWTIRRTTADAASALAPSWARARIRVLEDLYAIGRREVESEIIAISKRFGVLSRFTAFLAVDRSAVVNPGGRLYQAVQPVEPPAGWAEATPRPRAAMAAMLPSYASLPAGGVMPTPAAPLGAPPVIHAHSAGQAASGAPRPVVAKSIALPPRIPVESHARRSAPSQTQRGSRSELEAADVSAYRGSLESLARELAALAGASTHAADAKAVRLLRERLTEWVEDVRSVGGNELATAVEKLVTRLTAVLAAASDGAELRAIAAELAAIAAGTAPPPKGRVAFWK